MYLNIYQFKSNHMSYNRIVLVAVLFLGFLCSCHPARHIVQAYHHDEGLRGDLTKTQTGIIAGTLSNFPDNSQVAVALIHGGETYFYGLQRQDDTLKKVHNAQSIFEIGSLTKVFTTHLLVNALNDGLIPNLEVRINEFGAPVIPEAPTLTFRQLANHTSGLPGELSGNILNTDPANPYKKWDHHKLTAFLDGVKPEAEPGTKYIYSNIGMAVLANTICTLHQQSYERLLQEEIFKPIGMSSSTTIRNLTRDRLVSGNNWKGKPTANWDLGALEGAGAILSTAEDLATYLKWNFAALDKQLKPMTESTFTINNDLDIALGWHIVKGKTSKPFLWHNGGTGGYKSSVAINPQTKTAVVILSNIGATNNPKRGLIDNLCFDLMKSLNG